MSDKITTLADFRTYGKGAFRMAIAHCHPLESSRLSSRGPAQIKNKIQPSCMDFFGEPVGEGASEDALNDEGFEQGDFFGELLGEGASEDALNDERLEQDVAAAHQDGDDMEVLRLLEANPGNGLCFASVGAEMLRYVSDSMNDCPDHVSFVITLGCGRGMLEWLLERHFARESSTGVQVRSFELAGVPTDFFDESSVHRVVQGDAPVELPKEAVILCVWGETGMLTQYLPNYKGEQLITIGAEGFTDPEPGCDIDGWCVHGSAEFGEDVVTVYNRCTSKCDV